MECNQNDKNTVDGYRTKIVAAIQLLHGNHESRTAMKLSLNIMSNYWLPARSGYLTQLEQVEAVKLDAVEAPVILRTIHSMHFLQKADEERPLVTIHESYLRCRIVGLSLQFSVRWTPGFEDLPGARDRTNL